MLRYVLLSLFEWCCLFGCVCLSYCDVVRVCCCCVALCIFLNVGAYGCVLVSCLFVRVIGAFCCVVLCCVAF